MSCPVCIEIKLKESLEKIESCSCNKIENSIFETFEPVTKQSCPKNEFIQEEKIESCVCPEEPTFIRVCKTENIDFNSDIFGIYLNKMNTEKVCNGYHKIKHITNLINTTNKVEENQPLCDCGENQ